MFCVHSARRPAILTLIMKGSKMAKQKPVKEFRVGKVKAAVWKNEEDKDGKTIVKYSVRIQKTFRDDNGEYHETNNFFPEELPKLALAASKAYEFVALRERNPEDSF